MKSKRHTPEQVLKKIAQGDKMLNEGATVSEVARSFGVTETTWHLGKSTYGGFATIDDARKWMSDFVDHYHNNHQYSGIKFVTPQQAHSGEHIELLALRREAVGGSNAKLHQDFCISGKCRDFRSSIRGINNSY